jgi:RND family efflux transporter MFP subunit
VANVELKASRVVMEKSTLLAGESGIIGDIFVEQGEAVTPNTLVGSLIVVSSVEAKFGVLEKDLPKVVVGQTAQVMVDAYPGRVFNGKIATVSKQVTGQTRTSDAWVAIENPDMNLLPGMFARIKVMVYKANNVIAVPTESVQKDEQGANFVYVVDLQKKVAAKKLVEIAYSRPDYTHVSSGITEEDWIATSGFDDLKDQSPVEVLEMQEKAF